MEVEYKPLQREAENNNRVFGLITQRQKEIDLTGSDEDEQRPNPRSARG